jgi:type I restriction enzyme S subunit
VTGTLVKIARFADLDRWDPQSASDEFSFAWPTTTLGEVALIRLGVQIPRKGSVNRGEPFKYLRSKNVRRGYVDIADVKTMHVPASQAADITLQRGDLVFVEGSGSIAEVGRAALWNGAIAKVIHQNSVIRARLQSEDLDPEFVLTWFNSRAGNSYVRAQATTTSGLYHLGSGKLAGAPIPIPPKKVQRDIVATHRQALDQADAEHRRSMSLDAQAWKHFSDRLVDPRLDSPVLGMVAIARFSSLDRWDTDAVPAGINTVYPLARLEDVADIRLGTQVPRKGTQAPGVELPYLRAANVQSGYIKLDDVKTMFVPQNMADRLQLEPRDVLFVEGNSREEVGRAAVWRGSDETMIIQNSIIRTRLLDNALDPEYVASWFNSDIGRTYAREQATTTTGSLWHLGAGKLAGAPIPVPPPAIQRQLVAELKDQLAEAHCCRQAALDFREKAEQDLAQAIYLMPNY